MSQETCSASPFSALSYQEQQARWLEWRSRQLDYRPAAEETETPRPESSALALLSAAERGADSGNP